MADFLNTDYLNWDTSTGTEAYTVGNTGLGFTTGQGWQGASSGLGTATINPNKLSGGNVFGNIMNPELQSKYGELMDLEIQNRQGILDKQNSWMGQASPYVKGFSNVASGLGSLANIYTGFKSLGIMEDQLDIAKDQWATTKEELNRVKGVRDKLNTSYMA